MSTTRTSKTTTIEQAPFVIPDLSIKELLSAIPAHCFERSALRSSLYILLDVVVIASACQLAYLLEGLLTPGGPFNLPDVLYPFARFSVWALYSFIAGLFGFGLWIIGHECGHYAFSESKMVNDVVGFIIHSALGVPFFSWRFSHARHHAGTGHVSRDEVFVPRTRSELGLPPLDPAKEDLGGASVSEEVMKELWEAIGDSPISAAYYSFVYLVWGWPAYLLTNVGGQKRYPQDTHHFNPSATIFRPDQRTQVVISNIGILMWMGAILASISHWGFFNVLTTYLVPYLWVNHWLILVTFLQHTDPMLPHYRASEYTFPRGALSTLDRSLLGDLGSVMGWLGAVATHGISETHVVHHVCSRIPHYHAWEATDALRKRLAQEGIKLEGRPGGWAEMYRVFRECKFIEDEGEIVFYKNARGLAAMKPVFQGEGATSDSGVEFSEERQ
ncbi:hypothetical protein FKP32DRAFT_1611689 [Trametes sanguinea]|nr:hypothetical protein FKP32DRAFT_1611689 [Trametes sanguinea]